MDCLTPASLRLDKKCGASAIAKNKKCRKGSQAGWGERSARIAGNVTAIGSIAGGVYGLSKGKDEALGYALGGLGVASTLKGAANVRKGYRTGNKKLREFGNRQMSGGVSLAAYGVLAGDFQKESRKAREWKAEQARQREAGQKAPPPRNSYKGDPFKDLGVDPKASDADIKKAYARAARANHPDLGGDEEKMKKVNAAYEAIKRRRGRKDDFTLDSLTAEGVSTVRADQKCGKSTIAKGKKCRKGMGMLKKALVGAAIGAGVVAVAAHTQHKRGQAGVSGIKAARKVGKSMSNEEHRQQSKDFVKGRIEKLKKRVPLSKARTRKKLNELMGRQTNYKVKRPKKSATNTKKPRSTHDLPKLAPGSGKSL